MRLALHVSCFPNTESLDIQWSLLPVTVKLTMEQIPMATAERL